MAVTSEPSSVGVIVAASGNAPQRAPGPAGDGVTGEAGPTPALPVAPLDFAQVYETHLDFVWRSLRLLGVSPNAVEDATQEVFTIVSRQLVRFEGRSSLRTWLFAILQRVAANQRRTTRRKLRQLEPLCEESIGHGPTPHSHAEAAEVIDLVQSFCDTLDVERRAVFVLSLLEELPAPEVSEVLGIPVNTVYSRVRSLREGLRRLLDQREVEHD
ncbi:MAG: sigma-70 family RNA polymerase sigma factor [Deltaproteobacteria bacterium]